MALSVLITMNETTPFGLFDSLKNQFIYTGTREDMYTQKDRLERDEQHQDNTLWAVNMIAERRADLLSAGSSEAQAEAILRIHYPICYPIWKAHTTVPQEA